MGSKQLYQHLRESSLYKQQAHQLRGEQQRKGAELGDTIAFSKGFLTSGQGILVPAVISGDYEDAPVHGMLRRATKPQAAQNWQFQSCSCEEASPFSFPLLRVTDEQQGHEAFKPPTLQLSQPGNLGLAQSQAERTPKVGTGTLSNLGTWSPWGDRVTLEE